MEKQINLNDTSIRARSKKEVYLVLTAEGGLYLPPILDSKKSYLKGIMIGTNKFIYCKDVSVIKLSQIKSLSIKEVLNYSINNTNIKEYLPEYSFDKLPNREWLCGVVNTISGASFKAFIHTVLNNREKSILINKSLNVTAIPEIVQIFANFKYVSYSKGRTYYLKGERLTGRKRKHYQMECDQTEESKRKTQELKQKI